MKKYILQLLFIITSITVIPAINSCNKINDTITEKNSAEKVMDWTHFVSKDSVQVFVNRLANYKKSNTIIAKSMVVQSHLFNSANSMMTTMLLNQDCVGLRIYYGLTSKGDMIPIVCGVDKNGGDIYWKKGNSNVYSKTNTVSYTSEVEGLLDNSQGEPPIMTISSNYISPQ